MGFLWGMRLTRLADDVSQLKELIKEVCEEIIDKTEPTYDEFGKLHLDKVGRNLLRNEMRQRLKEKLK